MAAIAYLRVFFLSALITMVLSDGIMRLRFEEYVNPRGKLSNGHCCDGKFFFCQKHGCDHMFFICVDDQRGPDDVEVCLYGDRTTDKIKNQDHNIFRDSIAGVANPMEFHVTGAIPDAVRLKVVVKDKDTGHFWLGHNDDVETLRGIARVDPDPSSNRQGISGRTRLKARLLCVAITNGNSLYFKLWFSCDEDYYGDRCEVHCPPPNYHQHYICDEDTGEKICEPGFAGEYCDRPAPTRRPRPTWRPRPTQGH